ncbi:MAG: hypothetical protein Q7J47_16680 [Azoarcus sp.]|nr:hypothetical protein [Azoarcus sp.]
MPNADAGQAVLQWLHGIDLGAARAEGGVPGAQEVDDMNSVKLVAITLVVAGVLALVYGGFSYTKDSTAVKLGPLELTVQEKETVNVPMWAGIGAIAAGGLLLVFGGRK